MKFRRKPETIDAVQWDGTYEMFHFICGYFIAIEVSPEKYKTRDRKTVFSFQDEKFVILNLSGKKEIRPGDWIIEDKNERIFTLRPQIFEQRYEKDV